MKLALGTAQIGLDYGVANRTGKASTEEATAILRTARQNGVDMLDTAVAYGDSERRLGEIGVAGWNVVSKLPPIPDDVEHVGSWIDDVVRGSLERLRIEQLYGLLLHRPSQLTEPIGKEISAALSALKASGRVRKTGVSVYGPSELDAFKDSPHLDIVQSPFSLFDQRLTESGWLARLKERGTEVHVRSIFLQGLLLLESGDRPSQFDRWSAHLARYDAWLIQHGLSRLDACVAFALSVPEIDRVVVGVETAAQLSGILAARAARVTTARELSSPDAALIDPRTWTTT